MEKDLYEENSDLFGSSRFIVLTSQVDSQPGSALDLPALHQVEEESRDSEVVYPLMDPTAGKSGSLVLVSDSEVEALEKPEASNEAYVIGETASEDNMEPTVGASSSSDETANVTVIAREGAAPHQQEEPMSQDLFAPKEEDKEDQPVSTPSHHLASLQLSGQPMLVPETLEESLDQEICPSPDAYGDMPHIIPSTPSLTIAEEGVETEYNPGEVQTLNSQQGKAQRKSPQSSSGAQSLTDSHKQTSVGASTSVGVAEGPVGPTLAGEVPEWQQSQSLCLLMTTTPSSASASQLPSQQGEQSQSRTDSQAVFQSQDVKCENVFAVSQNQQVGPLLSQSSAQPVSAFSLSVLKPATECERRRTGKADTETTNDSSSKESSSEVLASWGASARAPISIDMVHSQSQSASETTFKLERPEVAAGEKKVVREEGSGSQNIFQRTRQSRRIAAARQASGHSEDRWSEDVFSHMGKAAEGQPSLSDSDPIPCSQNRSARCMSVKQDDRMERVVEESEPPADMVDVYNVDTVMDSEPEDEGTQSYDAFPALSRNSSQSVLAPAGEAEEAQELELLPSIPVVTPSPPKEPSRDEAASHAGQSQPFSQRASQVAARLAQLSALSEHAQQSPPACPKRVSSQPARVSSHSPGSHPRPTSQPGRSPPAMPSQRTGSQTVMPGQRTGSQTVMPGQQTGSQTVMPGQHTGSQTVMPGQRTGSQTVMPGQQTGSQTVMPSQHTGSQTVMPGQQTGSQTVMPGQRTGSQTVMQLAAEGISSGMTAEASRPEDGRTADSCHVGKDGDQPLSVGKGVTSSIVGERGGGGVCRGPGRPDPDPYTFRSSQSQLMMEADGTSTSRAETSISTARAVKNRPKGLLGRRRKLLVKKKSEVNPKGEVKTSSTDDGTASKTLVRPARKSKRGEKFTSLQKTVPGASVQRASGAKDNAEVSTEMNPPKPPSSMQHQSTVRISTASEKTAAGPFTRFSTQPAVERPEPQPSTSRAGAGGASQDSDKLRKRKSVEFGSVVQIDSPPLPFSLEQSYSDSQSSDTLLEVTEATKFIMRLVKERIVVRRIDKDGNIVHEQISVKEGKPELMEEINHTYKRRVSSSLSPSRSGSTLESGDLADISSSSLSNKASSGHSSSLERGGSGLSSLERGGSGISGLELPPPVPLSSAIPLEVDGSSLVDTRSSSRLMDTRSSSRLMDTRSSSRPPTSVPWRLSGEQSGPASVIENMDAPVGEHSLGGRSSVGVSPAISFISPDQSAIERDDSRLEAVVTSSSSGLASEALYSADNKQTSSDVPCAQQPLQAAPSSSSSSGMVPPTADEGSQLKQTTGTTTRSSRKATRCAAADSSQEENRRTMKARSSPESQSFLPGTESGGFSVVMSGTRKKSQGSASGTSSGKTAPTSAPSPKKSSSVRQQSSQEASERDTTPVTVQTSSKLEIGARVMCRWKDGFFYPAKFVGLNTGIGNKFKVLFEDGMEKMVRAIDLVMAQNLPLGQSVLVTGDDGVSDPGIVIKHIVDDNDEGEKEVVGRGGRLVREKGEALYDVAMDDGSTKRCRRSQLILSEDQASCLLSDDEYRATLGETDLSLVNTADVSLDNVIQGKRLRTKGSPAVGIPRIVSKASTSSAVSDDEGNSYSNSKKPAPSSSSPRLVVQSREVHHETPTGTKTPAQTASTSKSSSRKRKPGSVATSTPIPKQMKTSERHRTPRRAVQEELSPLGGAVASPEGPKRPTRKARMGLFENVKGPIPSSSGLFKGYVFLLTHVDKTPDVLAEEKRQLQNSPLETSTEESTDDGGDTTVIPFDKDHLVAQIKAGGGSVISKFLQSSLAGSGKKMFLISDTFQRTVKYLQCLAANVPAVSHTWITHSCTQNRLLDYKDYVLPAGISLEKHAILERSPSVTCLAGQRVLLTSSVAGFLEVWTSILELAQCKVLSKFAGNAAGNRSGVEVVVTDHTCVKSMEDKARVLGVPVVSTEWVVQCLINNRLLPHTAHPKYAHTYFKLVAKSSQDTS
ncbi:uncharacterized protein LOC143296874 isoform X2 [Babylonia areolata]|uniref:uncharacterized protein LOC143296874 isoform X2 n=1 Tax=Babylonia areolata TaxID=304850 RepID=UPI003FD1FD30